MAVAPITGTLKKAFFRDLTLGLGLGFGLAYYFWYGYHKKSVAVRDAWYRKEAAAKAAAAEE
ncbi:hypothetical protein CANCADRAFT_31353 [Tortispora caseinolytica NRRL Y-17796]|uniref:Cytochrome c oxidase subunit 9, mitochondrial n=1 Tax=Tortispora caseinolytica NRRL Y-17796 TaxID=767744 RepID=A0A1E4TF05_9ASCO|nr:hypothetical protein CANCADRAFT_31353 [Tortispora caseinolytica NRRL Y-17796]